MPISQSSLLDRILHGRAPLPQPPVSVLPLQGLTVLAVEDSRFASDALRLFCHRSGARLRRVETLRAAYAHLRVYRPDVMLVDLGLPDGRGDALICDLALQRPHGPVVIGISGDPSAQAIAMMAGAHGFIEKPFPSLALFQGEILRHLPDRADRSSPMANATTPTADPLALRDDLEHAAGLVRLHPQAGQRRYLAGFVAGLARAAGDPALIAAATSLNETKDFDTLHQLLAARIETTKGAFDGEGP